MRDSSPDPSTRSPHHSTTVLLVGDHEHVLWGLRKLIDGEWPRMMVTCIAKTLGEAFAAIDKHRPHVIVLDLFLGAWNMIGHFQELRERSGAEIVVFTGARDTELHRRSIAAGAHAVVLNDAPGEKLLAEIEKSHADAS